MGADEYQKNSKSADSVVLGVASLIIFLLMCGWVSTAL
jgi:hypothetical protein